MNKILEDYVNYCIEENMGEPEALSKYCREVGIAYTTILSKTNSKNYTEFLKKAGFINYVEDKGYPKMKPGVFCSECVHCSAVCGKDLKQCKKKALKEKIYFADNYIHLFLMEKGENYG